MAQCCGHTCAAGRSSVTVAAHRAVGRQVGEIEPRVEQTNAQFEEAAAAQRAAERNLRQLHSKVGTYTPAHRTSCYLLRAQTYAVCSLCVSSAAAVIYAGGPDRAARLRAGHCVCCHPPAAQQGGMLLVSCPPHNMPGAAAASQYTMLSSSAHVGKLCRWIRSSRAFWSWTRCLLPHASCTARCAAFCLPLPMSIFNAETTEQFTISSS